ncbi:MAG TPA: HEAT repeat domain-containing protein [Capsulimonadaceae bacterium]
MSSTTSVYSEALKSALDELNKAHSREMVENATFALSNIGQEAVTPLIELLESGEWKGTIYGILASIGDPLAIPCFVDGLDDKSKWVRWSAAEALIKMPSPDALEGLLRCLKDRDSLVRSAAVSAVAAIGNPVAVQPLTKMLDKKSLKDGERILVAKTIRNLQAGNG